MKSAMLLLPRIAVWLAAGLLRFVFAALGWFVVPFTLIGSGDKMTHHWFTWFGNSALVPLSHSKNRWTKYVWMAWRNPLEGLDGTLVQPIPEFTPNPDMMVRTSVQRSDHRWMAHRIFWEYWYLRRMGKKFFEFRVGWKFVDGNEDFVPTFQLGPKR